jgi:UDP-glucuronate decarboxylase
MDRMREWLPSAIHEIYHLASIASPPKYKKYPIETLDVNVIGTRNMLEIAVDYGTPKFLLTSTSEVYGDPAIHPQPESYYGNVNCVGERSCYDESKRCAETYVYEYRRKFDADFKICRIFNTYGPHMDFDDGRVITNMVRQFCRGERITIYGQGTQTRSFCFISDLLDGLVAMMASSEAGPMNLGNPYTECNMVELARKVAEVANKENVADNNMSSLDLVFRPLTENDPLIRRPDISLAQEKIGFHPKVGLLEGLKHMMDFYRETQM